MLQFLQRIGKALMLPIAVLPAAGLLLRLGQPDVFDIPVMAQAGAAVFDNLALIFAIGIAIGLSVDGSGAAGLAGAIQVMGVSHNITILAAQEGYGFDGIAVALIANSNPIGVIFSGLLFGAFKYGGTKMQAVGAPSEVVNIVIGSIVYFIALSSVLRMLYINLRNKKNKGGNA